MDTKTLKDIIYWKSKYTDEEVLTIYRKYYWENFWTKEITINEKFYNLLIKKVLKYLNK